MTKKVYKLLLLSCFLSPVTSWAERPAEIMESDAPATDAVYESQTPVAEDIPTPPPAQTAAPVESEVPTGDVIDMGSESSEIIVLDFPRRGMDMSKVKNELGEPLTRHPAVGNPPITRWDYEDRTIYFEYNRVIHTVAR